MNILTQQDPLYTKEDVLRSKAEYIKRVTANSYKKLLDIQTSGIDTVWHDPNFTPQEILTVLGNDAVKIFQVHGILTDCIKAIALVDGIVPEIKQPINAFEVVNDKIIVSPHPYTP